MNIKEKAEKGASLSDLFIIDAHTHMGTYRSTPAHGDASAKGLLGLMDKIGIKSCLNSHIMSVGPDCRLGNEIVYESMKKFPGRILGMCVVNPNYPEEIVPELDKRMFHGFTGVKIHPHSHNYFANGDNYHILYEYANKHKLIIISHTYWNNDISNQVCAPALFDGLAKKYKMIKFILGHSGGHPWGYEQSIAVAKKYDNVYLEACSSEAFTSFWLKRFIDALGDDRIFFGSDMPFHDPRPALGEVLFAKIPDKSKEKILGLNIKKLLP